jgi:hypothetical protein
MYQDGAYALDFEFQAVTDDADAAFLKGSDWKSTSDPVMKLDDCRAVCLERGVDRSVVTTPMPHRKFRGVHEPRTFKNWFNSECCRVEVGVMNYLNKNAPLNMYWGLDEGVRKGSLYSIEYGEKNTICFESFIGHWLEFEDNETKEVVHRHRVEHISMFGIGEAPPHGQTKGDVAVQVKSTLNHEWRKMKNVLRTFTPLGFKKERLPDDLWASIEAFYYNNRNYKVREEWEGKGLFVNWWEVDVFFIQIPWKLKASWQARLRELVEAWVGEPLEQTDMYGLRRYEEGARLLTHVDRESTHAASLIVNVAQGNVSQPWPVEIHDHAGRLHQITMDPGDVVFYESASCLHGRNTPLKGDGAYYVNLFTHYRPTGDPDWQYKENQPGTPPPLMDVGECRLEGTVDMIDQGAVKCDNPDIGPYLSPYMFTATSAQDLFDWWVNVTPQDQVDNKDEL